MTEHAGPGWYPDPQRRAEYRWWDGWVWTDQVANGGVRGNDPLVQPSSSPESTQGVGGAPHGAGGAGPLTATRAMATVSEVSSLRAGAGWQVVVGPTLPSFAALGGVAGRRGAGRFLQDPAMLLAVTTVLAVAPALVTETAGAGTLALPRLGVGLAAALGAVLAPRLSGRAAQAAVLLPLAFVGLQLWAMVSTWSSLSAGDSGLAAAGPHLLSGAVTVVVAVRAVAGLRRRTS